MWVIPRSDYSFFNDTIIDILLIAVGLLPLRLEKIEKPKKKGRKEVKRKDTGNKYVKTHFPRE